MKLIEIIQFLEKIAPKAYQADYDNSGLQVGLPEKEVKTCILSLDMTMEVLEEAISKKADLIITHHPPVFKGLKKITGSNEVEKIVYYAIKNDIAIYSMHTNLDHIKHGLNSILAEKIGIKDFKILKPTPGLLKKLIVFCPDIYENGVYIPEIVRNAMFSAGAGVIGDYDSCSYNTEGNGTFRGQNTTNPYIGTPGTLEVQKEIRIETIFPSHLQEQVVSAMIKAHPYEEVAYDIISLDNRHPQVGGGIIGRLEKEMTESDFLEKIKKTLNIPIVRHSKKTGRKIEKVAVCGGGGANLITDAINQKADVFLSSDFKYHDFFLPEGKIMIIDTGHFESEQFVLYLLHDILTKNFSTFAVLITSVNTNPVNYF